LNSEVKSLREREELLGVVNSPYFRFREEEYEEGEYEEYEQIYCNHYHHYLS